MPDLPEADPADAYFDVLIVGAGLSGIGAAWHLQRGCPDKTYAILEARAALGGTWDLFRAIRTGRASVATDRVDRFTPEGLLLESGRARPADIVVLATGLNIKLLGGVAITAPPSSPWPAAARAWPPSVTGISSRKR
jgi:cation diffusion facilitator CzcD-associated flavoprotein CzcO